VKRRELLLFGAVFLASAILAVLAALSLRQWEASAQRHVREQARDMATMTAEKIEMAVLKAEEEGLARLQLAVRDRALLRERVDAWKAETPFFDRAYIFARGGTLLYPAPPSEGPPPSFEEIRREIPPGFWDRGGRRHVPLGDGVACAAVLVEGLDEPLLAVLLRSEQGLRRGDPREDACRP
jgi:hypothetical protein